MSHLRPSVLSAFVYSALFGSLVKYTETHESSIVVRLVSLGLGTEVKDRIEYCEEGSMKVSRNVGSV